MKKNVLLNGFNNPIGKHLAKSLKQKGYYVYGTDAKEDFEGTCDRSLRFDINQFVKDVEYRIRFTQIFEELMPRVDVLINIIDVGSKSTLGSFDLGKWQESIDRCVTGPLLLCKLLLNKLVVSKGIIITFCAPPIGYLNGITLLSAIKGFNQAISIEFSESISTYSIASRPTSMKKGLVAYGEEKEETEEFLNVSDLIILLSNGGSGLSNGSHIEVGPI